MKCKSTSIDKKRGILWKNYFQSWRLHGLNFVYEEDEDLYGLYVSGISQEQYQEYMDKLTQAGFDDIIGEHDGNVVLKHNSGLYGAVVMYDDVDMTVGITKYDNLDALY